MISRRKFLGGGAAATLCGMLKSQDQISPALPMPPRKRPPSALRTGIEHVVVLMMENRSFDHLFGWLPNSDGKQTGLAYADYGGALYETFPLAPDYTGCRYPDVDHSYRGGRVQYDGGKMDGFLLDTANNLFALGYYVAGDLPFCSALALNYTTLDQYFCSILAPTYPNRIFVHAGQTDRLENTFALCTLPTIWDSLDNAGVSGRYYYNNVSFLELWGARYVNIAHTYDDFLHDAAAGTLPEVAFVDPLFTLTGGTAGGDFEPHSDVRVCDAFVAQTYHAVFSGPLRERTVFILTFDEWGGFFDHVAPPRVVAPNTVDPDLINGDALLGFRVPAIIASPFTRGSAGNPRVNQLLYDHTSILKLIEWRWNIPPLTARDGSDEVNNLALALDLECPLYDAPLLPFPQPPGVQPC
jgi:phospholipase C